MTEQNLFGLLGFYGISTIVGYLMPNPLYTYIYIYIYIYIKCIYMICKHLLLITFLNKSYPSAEMQSVYSTAPANWTGTKLNDCDKLKRKKFIFLYQGAHNNYQHKKWTQLPKFKTWTRLFAFHITLIPLEKVGLQLFSLKLWIRNSRYGRKKKNSKF